MNNTSGTSIRVLTRPSLLMVAALLLLNHSVQAEESPDIYNRVSLHSSVEGEVANDLLMAELFAEDEDRDAASLANRINAKMAWALEQLKRSPAIKVESGSYNTWPQRDRKGDKIIGWRSSQSVRIESDDFSAARKVIGVLQDRLQIRGLQMAAKPATRKAREDQLISEALNAFKQRASLVRDNMGEANYRIVHLDISTDRHSRPSPHMNMRGLEMASMSEVSEPAVAAGSSTVSIHVSGTIQLQ